MIWRRWASGALGISAVALALGGYAAVPHTAGAAQPRAQVRFTRAAPTVTQAITLRQAWDLALQGARSWSANAAMLSLQGVDSAADTTQSGRDGRRTAWLAALATPDKPADQLVERIVNGAVVMSIDVPVAPSVPPIGQPPTIDSDAAIGTALATRPDIGPSDGKLHGYGFVVRTDADGKVVVAVMGGYRSHPAQLDLDALSGKPLGAQVYAYPSRVIYSGDGGQSWQPSTLDGQEISGIAAVLGQPDAAYAVETGLRDLRLWKTGDGGQSWASVGVLPAAAGDRAQRITVAPLASGADAIAVGTPTGLWTSIDGGASWTRAAGLPDGTPLWLSPGQVGGVRGLLTTVSGGPQDGVYGSTDLSTWSKLRDGAYRLSPSSDGQMAAAVSDDAPTTAFLNAKAATVRPLALSLPALRMAGRFDGQGIELSESPDHVALSADGGATWTPTLDQSVAKQSLTSLAVGPAFPTDGIALAGGLNGGIFRSGDSGHSWRTAEMSAIPGGTAEIGDLTFTAQGHVVAISGGKGAWLPF